MLGGRSPDDSLTARTNSAGFLPFSLQVCTTVLRMQLCWAPVSLSLPKEFFRLTTVGRISRSARLLWYSPPPPVPSVQAKEDLPLPSETSKMQPIDLNSEALTSLSTFLLIEFK
jgi:hypothetical protein